MGIKINTFEIENVKRIKAITHDCTNKALTVIGGANNQGKTSILDAICFALGGEKYRPDNLQRDGGMAKAKIKLTLSNGMTVERSGPKASLKVSDPDGGRAGQALLNEFVSQLALNLPKFMAGNDADKAKTLLKILGVDQQLHEIETEETTLYNERHAVGQIKDRKRKHADELPEYAGVPDVPQSVGDLIKAQQAILAKNGENDLKRSKVKELIREHELLFAELTRQQELCEKLHAEFDVVTGNLDIAQKSAQDLHDECTDEIESSLNEIESTNVKIRYNLDKAKASDEADQLADDYLELDEKISDVRRERSALLENADFPIAGLSVNEDKQLCYNGHTWDCMSGSDQLKVATAIVRKLNPECAFVLVDKIEAMDAQALHNFGLWAQEQDLQVIATRVSNGDECSIIIEDGFVKEPEFKTGEF